MAIVEGQSMEAEARNCAEQDASPKPQPLTSFAEKPMAVVTGASSGIGRHIARRLAQDGMDLTLVARRQDRLEALRAELVSGAGVEVYVVAVDLSERSSSEQIVTDLNRYGRTVDILVNCAGFGSWGPFVDQDVDRELSMIDVNISALVHLTGLILPQMVARNKGQILNIASMASFQPGPGMATYYASKAFVLSFSEALSHELRGTKVSVTSHCPGATMTEFGGVAGNSQSRLFALRVVSAEDAADHAYDMMKKGRTVAIHGLLNKLTVFIQRFVPRGWVRAIAGWINGPSS